MIKMALVVGFVIATGYWFLMNSVMTIAMTQTQNYQRQYQQASAMVDNLQ